MRKRILALIMVGMLLVGIVPTDVYADVQDTEENTEVNTEVVDSTEVTEEVTEDVTENVIDTEYDSEMEEKETEIQEDQTDEFSVTDGGLLQPQVHIVDISLEDACKAIESTGVRVASEWDTYSTDYYYNQMNETEQAFYDGLDEVCYQFLTTNKDIPYAGYDCTDMISRGIISEQEAINIAVIFRYSNPQYYFLSSDIWKTSNAIALGIYPLFTDGSNRAVATSEVKAKIDTWEAEIMQENGVVAREKKAHDIIVNAMTYDPNYEILMQQGQSAFSTYELTAYTQSAYSVFHTNTTVCAGYTQAFTILCNGAGIDTIGVTSDSHAWNRVRINGSWYNVDCTWDDPVSVSPILWYDYFNRSTEYILDSAHIQNDFYDAYTPSCILDSGADDSSIGTVSNAIGTASQPVMSASYTTAGAKITLSSSTTNAKIYYTTDGTAPSVASAKCDLYTGAFTVTGSKTIKAIAVCDQYIDSNITQQVSTTYAVAFDSNGGTGVTSQYITKGASAVQPAAPTKSGYTFAGWYSNSTCTTAWDFTTNKVTTDTTLYAKWKKTTYKITYKLNSGTNSSSNPSTYKVTSSKITLKSPTRKKYVFAGWYTSLKYKTKVKKIYSGSTGDVTLYAKWTKVTVSKAAISKLKNVSSKKLAVTIKKISGAAGYQIKYATKKSMKSSKTVITTSTSKNISNLKKGTTYYVQVRAYKKDSKGNKIYGSWSKVKQLSIT